MGRRDAPGADCALFLWTERAHGHQDPAEAVDDLLTLARQREASTFGGFLERVCLNLSVELKRLVVLLLLHVGRLQGISREERLTLSSWFGDLTAGGSWN